MCKTTTMATEVQIQSAYRYCQRFARSHYENFPVASWLLPKKLRKPVAAIYTFARQADDIADEGEATASERLQQLDTFQQHLDAISNNQTISKDPIWIALADSIQQFDLPVSLLEDLLRAFRQDVTKTRYADLPQLLEYCQYSANPVGRLVLHLDEHPNDEQLYQSDCICSALQLINFFQDIAQDYLEKDRIYIPQDHLEKVGIHESQLLAADSHQLASALRPLFEYTQNLMRSGVPLGTSLSGRIGWEIRAMTLGGIQTLSLLMQQSDSQLLSRPRLSRCQQFSLLISASSNRYYRHRATILLQQTH